VPQLALSSKFELRDATLIQICNRWAARRAALAHARRSEVAAGSTGGELVDGGEVVWAGILFGIGLKLILLVSHYLCGESSLSKHSRSKILIIIKVYPSKFEFKAYR
jgi:hypothetical protein